MRNETSASLPEVPARACRLEDDLLHGLLVEVEQVDRWVGELLKRDPFGPAVATQSSCLDENPRPSPTSGSTVDFTVAWAQRHSLSSG